MAVGKEGFGALLVWFRFWLIFCASEADDVVDFPPKLDLGATAGAEVGAEPLLGGLVVLALSSSAQGAGGGRSPISGGGRKESGGLGAVGGAEGLNVGAAECWLGNCG